MIRTGGFITFATILSPWMGAAGALLFAVGMGLMMPPLQSLATRTVDESIRGSVLGIYQSSVSLATIISTAIAGVIYAIQPSLPYWIGAGLSLAVLIPAMVLLRLSNEGKLGWQAQTTALD
jgi:MFS family permease